MSEQKERSMQFGSAYIRVSTDDQVELSPESQLEEIRKYAQREGISLLEDQIYIDAGISGKRAESRPEFMRMIATAKEKDCPFSVILLWKYSRFARNQEESIFYKSILRSKCGIDVVSVTEPLIAGPFGSLIERIIEWMDEFYSIRLSQEVKRSMKMNAVRGRLQEAYLAGVLNLEDFSIAKTEIESSITKAEAELQGLQEKSDTNIIEHQLRTAIATALKTLRSPDASLEEKNNAARSVIENCTFDKENSLLAITYRVIM